MTLHYQNGPIMATSQLQYNGISSSMTWATKQDPVVCAYGYKYDDLNRLSNGKYFRGGDNGMVHDGSFDERFIDYDANGNLKTLYRYGAGMAPVDSLGYQYPAAGNRLSYVTDSVGDVPGVADYPGGKAAVQGFWYDANGNMTRCADKGIDTIIYSLLNKPTGIDFGNGEKIGYIYDGTGNKVAKLNRNGDVPEASLIYAGNFIYDLTGELKYILTAEGRLVPDNGSFRTEYFMKDHLGDTRATYAQAAPGLAQVAEYQHYYPNGLRVESLCYTSGVDEPNPYLYNGKELQSEYGLEWYDYGARYYDPQLGRWHSVDPLAESYRRWSPYIYGVDNPLRFIDPDGMGLLDKIIGSVVGLVTNLTNPVTSIVVRSVVANHIISSTKDYNSALTKADQASQVAGAFMIANGTTNAGTGVLATPETGPVGASVIAAGVVESATGLVLTANATVNLAVGNNYGDETKNGPDEAKTTTEVKTRNDKGADGATSEHLIEKDSKGNTVSKTHRVTNGNGDVVHQHQDHVSTEVNPATGKKTTRQFPDEWIQYPTVPK